MTSEVVTALAERLDEDTSFTAAFEDDPLTTLRSELVAGAPDDVIQRASADVEAHISARKPATVAAVAAVLGTFAFAQQASAASQPASSTLQATAQVAAEATAQVAPQLTTQIRTQAKVQLKPQAHTQIKPQAKAQISRTAQANWHGVQPQRAKA